MKIVLEYVRMLLVLWFAQFVSASKCFVGINILPAATIQ